MRPRHLTTLALAALLGGLLVGPRLADCDPPKAGPDLRRASIDDKPMRVAVSVSKASSFVLSLPEHFWIQSQNVQERPHSLDGDGVTLQYVLNLANGGFRSLVYFGAAAMPPAAAGESAAARLLRSATEYTAALGDHLKHVGVDLVTDAAKIHVKSVAIRGAFAARTSVFTTSQPDATKTPVTWTDEGIFATVDGADSMAYLIVQSDRGGTSLEKVLPGLGVERSDDVYKKGSVVKLVEVTTGSDKSILSRFACFECPRGIAPDREARAQENVVFAERRVEADKTLESRLRRRPLGVAAKTLEDEGAMEMRQMEVQVPGAPKKVTLATRGAEALLYTYAVEAGGAPATASTAVFRVEDQIWSLTWTLTGDEARVKSDRLALEALLNTMQIAVR